MDVERSSPVKKVLVRKYAHSYRFRVSIYLLDFR